MQSQVLKYFPKILRRFLHYIYFDLIMRIYEYINPNKKVKFRNTILENGNILDFKTKALIRHNLYEPYEIDALESLDLSDNNFIDLGSSLGLCSLLVQENLNPNYSHVLVEPNIDLLNFSKEILNNKDNKNIYFENKAIFYGQDYIYFNKGSNVLSGYVSKEAGKSSLKIKNTTLESLLNYYSIESFNILIDIEGLSFSPLFKESRLFKQCEKIVIEEMFDKTFTQNKIESKLTDLGFKIRYIHDSWGSNIIGATKK